jgi:group I intron endonuclease
MDMGEIYCLKSPSGKMYVGQCVKFLSSGKKYGYLSRWNGHKNEAKNHKNCSVALDNAIRKYGDNSFELQVLKECKIDELDYWENFYIEEINTLHPDGYNLTTGKSNSRQSESTKQKRRESMLGKNKGKSFPKRERKEVEDNVLPKYLRRYKDSSGKEGYRISNHPFLKDKSFVSSKISMDEKLQSAIEYLNTYK